MIWVCEVANATMARRSPSARVAGFTAGGLIGSRVVVVVAWVEVVAGTVVVVAAVEVTGTVVVVTTVVVGVTVVEAGSVVVVCATVVVVVCATVVVVAISVVVGAMVVVVSGSVSSVVVAGRMGSDPKVSASGSGANCLSVGRVEMIMASPISVLMVVEVAAGPALAGRTSAGGPMTRRFGSCLVSKPQALSTKRSTKTHR